MWSVRKVCPLWLLTDVGDLWVRDDVGVAVHLESNQEHETAPLPPASIFYAPAKVTLQPWRPRQTARQVPGPQRPRRSLKGEFPPSLPSNANADLRRVYSKDRSEWFDPCQEAASRSIRCLHRNGGDRSLCSDYFQSVVDLNSSAATTLS